MTGHSCCPLHRNTGPGWRCGWTLPAWAQLCKGNWAEKGRFVPHGRSRRQCLARASQRAVEGLCFMAQPMDFAGTTSGPVDP